MVVDFEVKVTGFLFPPSWGCSRVVVGSWAG